MKVAAAEADTVMEPEYGFRHLFVIGAFGLPGKHPRVCDDRFKRRDILLRVGIRELAQGGALDGEPCFKQRLHLLPCQLTPVMPENARQRLKRSRFPLFLF